MDNGEPIHNDGESTTTVSQSQPMSWMKKHQLEEKLHEKIDDKLYDAVIFRLKKLATHERSNEIESFLRKYKVPVSTSSINPLEDVRISGDEVFSMGYRKTAIADVRMKLGAGNITVNNKAFFDYFPERNERIQILYPLLLTQTLEGVDIEIQVIGGGLSGQSGAIRLGVSRAIAAFRPEHFDVLNTHGLLTRDFRQKERKKPGRRRARRGHQWVKR